jgi:predicted P-loop ATPase
MSTNTVEVIDSKYLARAQAISRGICPSPEEQSDYATAHVAAARRGIQLEELQEWPLTYQSARRRWVKDGNEAQELRASGLWCFRRSKAKAAKIAAWKAAKDAGEEPAAIEDGEDKALVGMRARLGGCLVLPVYDLEGKVSSWVGRLAGTRPLAEVTGDYEPDEADVACVGEGGKYIYLPRVRSSVTKYAGLGSFETPRVEEFFPLLLSPRLIEERKGGYKNAATTPVWICEGVFDGVLAFLGGAASIATHGAYCYAQQVKLLVETLRDFARHHYQLLLCFDKDPKRWDPYKKLQLGPGQRGSCMLLSAIWKIDPTVARAIRVVELPSKPDGSKLDLGDLLAGAAASVTAPTPTGDLELAELEKEERQGYVQAVKAARRKLLDRLAAAALRSRDYLVAQIPADVDAADRTAALREVGLLDVAAVDPDTWDAVVDDVAAKFGLVKAHDVRAWKSSIGRKAKEKAKEVKATLREEAPDVDDLEQYRREDGSLEPCYDAARTALEQNFKGRLAWDEMALDVYWDDAALDPLQEGNLERWLSRKQGWRGNVETFRRAVGHAARTCKTVNPVREYLEKVRGKWKPGKDEDMIPLILKAMGKPGTTLDTGSTFVLDPGVDAEAYMDAVMIRKWLIAAVARVFRPGCKVDCMLILQGLQETRKSSFFEALVPEARFFTDSHIDVKNKDSRLLMRKHWILEIQEVDNSAWYDSISEWKAFVTTKVDSLRPPYGAKIEEYPRMSILCGSTNEEEFLVDPTGHRRFWVVRIPLEWGQQIDAAAIERVRDLIWSQAVYAYDQWVARGARKDDPCWWFTLSEKFAHAAVTDRYTVTDPLREMVREALIHQPKREVTAREVAQMLDIDTVGKPGKTKQIGHALKALGWVKCEREGDVFVWRAPENFPKFDPNLRLVVEDMHAWGAPKPEGKGG